jgi:hypothetical protein
MADLPSKNRVWNFLTTSDFSAWTFVSQPVESHQATWDTSTKTVSGMSIWLSRDPIGEWAGEPNSYAFAKNQSVILVDSFGQLSVNYTSPQCPDKNKVVSIDIARLTLRSGDEDIRGGTQYRNRVLTCTAELDDPRKKEERTDDKDKKNKTSCTVTCTVTWDYQIMLLDTLDKSAAWGAVPISYDGALGHEQKHVSAVIANVKTYVVDPLTKEPASFDSIQKAKDAAASYESKYGKILQGVAPNNANDLRAYSGPGNGGTHGQYDHPQANTPYRPLPVSTQQDAK